MLLQGIMADFPISESLKLDQAERQGGPHRTWPHWWLLLLLSSREPGLEGSLSLTTCKSWDGDSAGAPGSSWGFYRLLKNVGKKMCSCV